MSEFLDSLTVRDATPEDLAVVVAIHNEAIPGRRASAYLEPVTVEQRREWFEGHSPERRPLWIVDEAGPDGEQRPIAWGCLTDYSPRPAYAITAEVSIYVTTDRHGRGVGQWLLGKLVDACPRLGVERLISLVFAHNGQSLRTHEKLGFDRWGLLPGVTNMDGDRRDVVVLGKEIPPAGG